VNSEVEFEAVAEVVEAEERGGGNLNRVFGEVGVEEFDDAANRL